MFRYLKCLLIFIFYSFSGILKAQITDTLDIRKQRVVRFEPLRFLYKANVEYEQIWDHFSAGLALDYYHTSLVDETTGLKAGLFGRVYFPADWTSRFYIQGKFLVGRFRQVIDENHTEYFYYDDQPYNPSVSSASNYVNTNWFLTQGGSFGIGVHMMTKGDIAFSFDPKIEIQFLPYSSKPDQIFYTTEYYVDSSGNIYNIVENPPDESYQERWAWSILGPGAILYPSLKMGIVF